MLEVSAFGAIGDSATVCQKELVGGKGAALAEMASLGLPVPPGFTLTTELCNLYRWLHQYGRKAEDKDAVIEDIMELIVTPMLERLESHFGYMPLLSVRSGARVSMPGMMDTVLNVGLVESNLVEWADRIGGRATLDSYRRLIQMYGSVVLNVEDRHFEGILQSVKDRAGVEDDAGLENEHLFGLNEKYLQLLDSINEPLPQTLEEQLAGAIRAVFDSWDNDRAKHYRKMHGYPDDWGTAVVVQAMVFGNMNEQSCSGVLFTRDPATGQPGVVGEFLPNAQGEDVVAGVRTPQPLIDMFDWNESAHIELFELAHKMELHYRDMQDMEFTVQDGKLYILQTRDGKRTAKAAFRIAHNMYTEEMISKEDMRKRLTGKMYDALKCTKIDPEHYVEPCHKGIPAGGNVVSGVIATSSSMAVALAGKANVILVTNETTPNDIKGMEASVGILTRTGGATSHAAVVARGLNKACVVGCQDLDLDTVADNTHVTIDGATGEVWLKDMPLVGGGSDSYAETVLEILRGAKEKAPAYVFSGTLQEGEPVWIDTAHMSVSNMVDVIAALTYHPLVVIELSDWFSNGDGLDDNFFKTMITPQYIKEARLEGLKTKVLALEAIAVTKHPVVFVKLPDIAPAAYKKSLEKAGYTVLGSVNTVADLLKGGVVDPSTDFIKKVMGGKTAYNKMIAMLKKNGVEFMDMPKPVYKEMEVYELLG